MDKMQSQLNQYSMLLSISGVQHKYNPTALKLIADELAMRPHLQVKSILQTDARESNEVLVELAYWGLSKELAEKQAAEELFEIICAVLAHPEGVSVHVVSIKHNQ